MNFLAHFYLSPQTEEHLFGSFLGDFTKGEVPRNLNSAIREGIQLHRLVDSYSEDQTYFVKSKKRFPKKLRRYSGILVDIYYDHYLAKNWDQYSTIPLDIYSESMQKMLHEHQEFMPEFAVRFYRYMRENDLPEAYKNMEMIKKVLHGISTYRLKKENPVLEAYDFLQENYANLEDDFHNFFKRARIECNDMIDLASQIQKG